jgi:hypothetical protein
MNPTTTTPYSGSAILQVMFIRNLKSDLRCTLIIGKGHATFLAGGGVRGCAEEEHRRGGYVVLGRKLDLPDHHLALYVLLAGLVVNFIQLVHGLLVQEINPGVGTWIPHNGLHSIASWSAFWCERRSAKNDKRESNKEAKSRTCCRIKKQECKLS